MDNNNLIILAKKIQSILSDSSILRWIDKKIYIENYDELLEPIFIIGAPRVGSTVLFQALIAKYKFAYLTNLHSLFFNQICLAEYLSKILKAVGFQYRNSFQSNYGYSKGILAPSEAGPVFRLWFGEADHVQQAVPTNHFKAKKNIATLCKITDAPFLSKNLFNSMRLQTILKCFPRAFLIWIQRDHDATRKSILKMRQNLHGDVKRWVSVNVPHQEKIMKLDAERQIDEQIKAITQHIEEIFLSRNLSLNYIVTYESFCKNPEPIIVDIAEKYNLVTKKQLDPNHFSDKLKIYPSSA